jgi:hypothetical protein
MTTRLAFSERVDYSPLQVLENTLASGMSPRKSVAFFTSIGFTPMGGMRRKYKTRKGNSVGRLATVFNILPTPLENGFSVSARSKTMSRRPSSVRARLQDIRLTLEPLRGSAASLLHPVDINEQLDALAAICTELASREAQTRSKAPRSMVLETFELAHLMGWTALNDHEKQLIELLRRTTWHGRNIVMDLALTMRRTHPWVHDSTENTKTTYPNNGFFCAEGAEAHS